MSKSFIGDDVLAEMTEGQAADAAFDIESAGEESSATGLERSELLKLANSLVDQRPTKETTATPTDRPAPTIAKRVKRKKKNRAATRGKAKARVAAPAVKQRFGLPDGFVPRLQRYGRSVLLELNIYRLPNGVEYLPAHPLGTLGARQHLYALLSVEQYVAQRRGSVYVRNDGRIFDYSRDGVDPGEDIFDTGYTIYDLERTGRYAPPLAVKGKRRAPEKFRGAAAGQ